MARTDVVVGLAEALHRQVRRHGTTPTLEELELALAAFVADQLFGVAGASGAPLMAVCDRFADQVEMLAEIQRTRRRAAPAG